MIDPKTLAAAKLEFILAIALDADLPKLSIRVAALLAGRYMHYEHDGVAWPAVSRLCGDLQIQSESKVRDALYALLERGHLEADRKLGASTRYQIAQCYFESRTQPQGGAGFSDTSPRDGATPQPRDGATPQPRDGATPQPRDGAEGKPQGGATNTVNKIPLIDYRRLNSGPSLDSRSENHPLADQVRTRRNSDFEANSHQEYFSHYRRGASIDDDLPF
jgi:hypothetical protein